MVYTGKIAYFVDFPGILGWFDYPEGIKCG